VQELQRAEDEQVSISVRLQKQIDQQKEFAVTKFAADILEIFDNLNRALDNCPENQKKDNVLHEGVQMTSSIGNNVLKRYGIAPIETEIGSQFDFKVHEVVFDQVVPGYEKGQIIFVMQPGYTIGDRILRVAKVGVAKD